MKKPKLKIEVVSKPNGYALTVHGKKTTEHFYFNLHTLASKLEKLHEEQLAEQNNSNNGK